MPKNETLPALRILMLAPEPFFQPRGTPISIYFRLSALSRLGHMVDVVTYPLGQDRRFDNVTLTRVPNIGLRRIKIGPSLAKIPLDLFLLGAALWKTSTRRYDLIFTHEEAGWFGTMLSRLWGIPHVYDMHSSLPQQLINYRFTDSPLLLGLFRVLERNVLRNARAVIVICPDLRRMVEEEGFAEKAVLLENICDFEGAELTERQLESLRRSIAPNGEKILVYTGNFQYYQGIPLLLDSLTRLAD
ncbi:MAG: glycosyltransferase, partial [Candidatus Aminicenantes bacterium]|nr:glycosyltransferase [Candidatus Aminicenantes bacterium]